MTLSEIKAAVDQGLIVHWASPSYRVKRHDAGGYYIAHDSGQAIALTHSDGQTLNGEPFEFFLAT